MRAASAEVSDPKAQDPAYRPCGVELSSRAIDVAPDVHCRIKPYMIKAAPLRGAGAGHSGLCLGRPGRAPVPTPKFTADQPGCLDAVGGWPGGQSHPPVHDLLGVIGGLAGREPTVAVFGDCHDRREDLPGHVGAVGGGAVVGCVVTGSRPALPRFPLIASGWTSPFTRRGAGV
jgi:hypothetical protein